MINGAENLLNDINIFFFSPIDTSVIEKELKSIG